MHLRLGLSWQIIPVVLLFLASLATLLFNSFAVLGLSRREARVREEVRAASRRMAEVAAELLRQNPLAEGHKMPRDLDQELREGSRRALADSPGTEGGFYLGGDFDQFTGYAFPTRSLEAPPPGPPKAGPKRGPAPAGSGEQREPPPLELPYIRLQAQRSLTQQAGDPPLVEVREVGPSRVVVASEPVGLHRPALAAAWVMVRLTGPEQQQEKARSFQLSTTLALLGLGLALGLSVSLSRTVKAERLRREQLVEDLRRAEHLAALGRLLAGVAHEVRNPLAAIRSTVQLWQRLPDRVRAPDSVAAVLQAVDRLESLVGRLLYFARAGQDQRRPVDVNTLVRETAALLGAKAEAQRVSWELDLEPALPRVGGSPQALHQVVLNLMTNALQAMPDGGRLGCRTALVPGGRVELLVSDSGPGVSDAARAHLFEPFFTTRPEGTGLGLSLCREIVGHHRGEISLQPGPGPGAVFRVVLPMGSMVSPLGSNQE
jgi:signal transduction histidine kinase